MGTTKKLSGKTMGYVILIGLVIVSWAIFKILTPHNFGSFSNMLNYFQASLIATVGAVGFYFVMVMGICLLYTSPSPRDPVLSRMPSSA